MSSAFQSNIVANMRLSSRSTENWVNGTSCDINVLKTHLKSTEVIKKKLQNVHKQTTIKIIIAIVEINAAATANFIEQV